VLRDLAHGDRPVRVRWHERIWACADPECETKTWTERSWQAGPRRHLTNRARSEICRRVGRGEHVGGEVSPGFQSGLAEGRIRIPVSADGRRPPPKICTQQSVTVPPEAGAKFGQSPR
jgi:hypothetical protein